MRMIEGRNPVYEAMKAGVKIKKILVQDGTKGQNLEEIFTKAQDIHIPIEMTTKMDLTSIAGSENHQGIIAYAEDYHYAELDDMIAYAQSKGEPPFVIILDEIQDPHNLGSIIRTANVAGAHGVVIPKHKASGITPVVTKTSAGAVEYTKVVQVTNIVRAIEELQKAGLWICAGTMDGDQSIYQADLKGPLGIVIGSEGEGIRRLVREKCDFFVQIPMYGEINSLNASVAAAIMIYEALRQRKHK